MIKAGISNSIQTKLGGSEYLTSGDVFNIRHLVGSSFYLSTQLSVRLGSLSVRWGDQQSTHQEEGALGLFNQTLYSQKRWKVPGPEISICNLSHISSHEDNFHLIQTKLFLESLQNEALIACNCMQFIIPHLSSISCQWQVYFLSQSEASNSFYEPMRSLTLAGLGSEGQEGN